MRLSLDTRQVGRVTILRYNGRIVAVQLPMKPLLEASSTPLHIQVESPHSARHLT
jgi:hypothetical protein